MSLGLQLSLVSVSSVALGVLSFTAWPAPLALGLAAGALALLFAETRRRLYAFFLWSMVAALAFAHGSHAREAALTRPPDWSLGGESPLVIEGRLKRDASMGEAGVRLEMTNVYVTPDGYATSGVAAGRAGRVALLHLDAMATVGGTMASASLEQWPGSPQSSAQGPRVRLA